MVIIVIAVFILLSSWHSTIARVYPFHLVNVDPAPGGCHHVVQASRLGLCVHQYADAIHFRRCHFIITQPES